MANNVISETDKAKMFDYLKDYQDNIKTNFGKYNLSDKRLQKFLSVNDIYLGRLNQKCKDKASKHQYYILFEQNKPRNKENDVVHHLLRHLRNAIAHGRISKKGKNLYRLSDKKEENTTMFGELNYKLFFDLIDLAKNT